MKLCINYLTEVIKLLNEGKLDKLDYIKYPSVSSTNLEEMINIKEQVGDIINYHGTIAYNDEIISLNNKEFKNKIDIEKTKKAIELSATKGLSIHITEQHRGTAPLDFNMKEESFKTISDNIKFLKETFKDIKFLIIENKEGKTFYEDPEFITRIVNENDCGFLFDTSHATYSAKALGIELYKYLDRLPLNKIYEIHANSAYYNKKNELCIHSPLNDKYYEILDYVLERSNPEIITIEFGGMHLDGEYKYFNNTDENIKEVEYEILNQINRVKSVIEKTNDIFLEFPTVEREKDALEYIEELKNHNSHIAGVGGLDKALDYNFWVNKKCEDHNGICSDESRVPASTYFVTRRKDNKIIGMVDVRHELNVFMKKTGAGHVGYSVRPTERLNGYGSKILKLALEKCKDLKIGQIIVGCLKDNIGSKKIIEKNGGKLLREFEYENEIHLEFEIEN